MPKTVVINLLGREGVKWIRGDVAVQFQSEPEQCDIDKHFFKGVMHRFYSETFATQVVRFVPFAFCFVEVMRVVVNMCSMVDAILKMNGKDEVGDVKQFLHQITQVPVDAMSLRHLRNPYLDNDTRLETLTKDDDLSLVMIAPSHKHLVMKIREVRDKCQDECVRFPLSDDVVMTIRGAFIVSQGLEREKPQMKEKKISSYPASLPSASTDGVSTMATLKGEINRLEMQILENKQRIADLKQQCKTVPVVIKLRQPSGNLLDIGTNIGKTVGQFKREDVSALVDVSANNIQLMVGANLMSNKKRLFSYNITGLSG